MSNRETNDPQHWRDRAAQMRALAVEMGDTEAATLMRDLAADYEKLAERAEIRAKGKTPRSNGKRRKDWAATNLRHGRPHGQTHFMVTRTAMIDADVRVPASGKAFDACDFHLLTAPACEPFSTAGF
jgi:hypothetical protein